MTTKSITQAAILLSVGTILHAIIPGDMMLACVFALVMINKDVKMTLLIGLCGGILAGLTATSAGALLPNVIDKVIASFFVFFGSKLIKTNNIFSNNIIKASLFFLGTLLSGTIYLNIKALTVGMEGVFGFIVAIVIPTAFVNIFLGLFLDKVLYLYNTKILKVKN